MKKIVVVCLLVASLLVAACGSVATPTEPQATTLLSMQNLKDEYGVQIMLIGATAGGGLIDFRYKVVDAAKAAALLGKDKAVPALVLTSGSVLTTTQTSLEGQPENQVIYYMLFANAQSAVKMGDQVAVQFGDLRTEPVAVQ